jgi:hypothetical protein
MRKFETSQAGQEKNEAGKSTPCVSQQMKMSTEDAQHLLNNWQQMTQKVTQSLAPDIGQREVRETRDYNTVAPSVGLTTPLRLARRKQSPSGSARRSLRPLPVLPCASCNHIGTACN